MRSRRSCAPAQVTCRPSRVTVVRGEVLDAAFAAGVIPGHDAVVSGLGMRYRHPWAKRESPDDFTYRATLNIVSGMKTAGVRRISVISAAGVGDSRAALNWPMRFLLATSNVGTWYAALERAEGVLRESGLDWQAVRPTTLTRKAATGRVRITSELSGDGVDSARRRRRIHPARAGEPAIHRAHADDHGNLGVCAVQKPFATRSAKRRSARQARLQVCATRFSWPIAQPASESQVPGVQIREAGPPASASISSFSRLTKVAGSSSWPPSARVAWSNRI